MVRLLVGFLFALEEMVDSRPLGAPGEEVCQDWILENNQNGKRAGKRV